MFIGCPVMRIMDDEDDELVLSSSSSSSLSSSDLTDDVASSSSVEAPLSEMSSLFSQLPFKRGLSIHFEGKSQSFTSLSDARRLEDLVKPDKKTAPLTKMMMRRRKSYGGWRVDGSHKHNAAAVSAALRSPKESSMAIAKKTTSRGSFVIKSSSRPPPPPPPCSNTQASIAQGRPSGDSTEMLLC